MRLDRIIAVRNDKTVYKDRNRCLKVFRSGYSKADVLSEALNQARAEQAGIPVPKIREIAVIDGKWTIVSDYVTGKTLARLLVEEKEKKKEKAALDKERKLQEAMLTVKNKYGKNSMLKGINFEEGATGRERNSQIGGHKA